MGGTHWGHWVQEGGRVLGVGDTVGGAQAEAQNAPVCMYVFLKILFIYFLERGGGREKERERNIHQLPLLRNPTGMKPTTLTGALTENQTRDLSLCRRTPNPPRRPGQGLTALPTSLAAQIKSEWFVSFYYMMGHMSPK